jgi:hypothetical protein
MPGDLNALMRSACTAGLSRLKRRPSEPDIKHFRFRCADALNLPIFSQRCVPFHGCPAFRPEKRLKFNYFPLQKIKRKR